MQNKNRKDELKQYHINREFFSAVLSSDIQRAEGARRAGADVNAIDAASLLAPIHAVFTTGDLAVAKYLVEQCNVHFGADGNGRCPSLIGCSTHHRKLTDYLLEAEAKFIDRHPEEPVRKFNRHPGL